MNNNGLWQLRVPTRGYTPKMVDHTMMKVYNALMFKLVRSRVTLAVGGDFIEVELWMNEREYMIELLTDEFKRETVVAKINSPAR